MESTLQGAQAAGEGQPDRQSVEMTPLGRLVMILLTVGACFGGWVVYQNYGSATHSGAPASIQSKAPNQPQAAQHASNTPSVSQLEQVLLKERREHGAQLAAWRAVSDANKQQIADLALGLQTLDGKLDAIQKMPVPAKAVRDDAAESAKALHKAVDTAKTSAAIDVASLPLESVTAQALNVSGFGKGVVGIGNQKLTVGQALQQGETIIAIDPESRSIVTNRRIINVTN